MRTILKKNQIIISAIAIMLIAAGYMNYTANTNDTIQSALLLDTEQYGELGDATLVSANTVQEENYENEYGQMSDTQTGEVVSTANQSTTIDNTYFTESRLEREKMYSQMLEAYQNILSNTQISDTQKEIAQNEIKNINNTKNAIMIAENLIKNKGFEDLIIFVNGNSISVVIKTETLTQEQIAQVQNIISREFGADVEDIHISNK